MATPVRLSDCENVARPQTCRKTQPAGIPHLEAVGNRNLVDFARTILDVANHALKVPTSKRCPDEAESNPSSRSRTPDSDEQDYSPKEPAAVEWLLQQGTLVLSEDNKFQPIHYDGTQPLHYSSHCGALEAAQWLVEQGASVTAQNDDKIQPIHVASRSGQLDMIKWLNDQGASLTCEDMAGFQPIHFASECGMLHVVQWLVEQGVSVNTENISGCQPLHVAAQSQQLKAVQWLIGKGAAPDAETDNGTTALQLAVPNTPTANFISAALIAPKEVRAMCSGLIALGHIVKDCNGRRLRDTGKLVEVQHEADGLRYSLAAAKQQVRILEEEARTGKRRKIANS